MHYKTFTRRETEPFHQTVTEHPVQREGTVAERFLDFP